MNKKIRDPIVGEEDPRTGESFLSRFHRRKTQARMAMMPNPPEAVSEVDGDAIVSAAMQEPDAEDLTDADMPPLESLSADSDFTGFLSPKVSESLRRAALRKLFHGEGFNVIDELDDYAEDFTTFEALGEIITADMRHRIELEAKKRAEAAKQALLASDETTTEPRNEVASNQTKAMPTEESSQNAQQTKAGAPVESSDAETERPDART